MSRLTQFSLIVVLAASAPAVAADWKLQNAEAGRGVVLTYASGEAVSYRFECGASDVIITETGVTQLLDPGTGQRIGDDAASVMPAGAAMMALYTGEGDPQFQPADAVKNPAGGWDLTIRLAKGDKQLTRIGKSDTMSLFTTGFTMAVAMDADGRAQWNAFLQQCRVSH